MNPKDRARLAWPWRIGIVVAASTACLIFLPVLARLPFGLEVTEYHRWAHALRAVLVGLVMSGVAVCACRWLDRRPLADLAIAASGLWRKLSLGAVAWLVPAAAAVTIVILTEQAAITITVGPADLLVLVVTQAVLVLLLEALPEELVFRGYIYANLAEHFSRWPAILIQAGIFGIWGVLIGARTLNDPAAIVQFTAFGVGVGFLRAITGSIWPGVGFHVAFQTIAQLLGGTQVQVASMTNVTLIEVVVYGLAPFAIGLPLLDWWLRKHPKLLEPCVTGIGPCSNPDDLSEGQGG